ncbi:serine/threonine-protein kinase [Sandaracinus amylolyticus]|uniref:Serine/threonine protein kinase n=1 Tax=Sandaracinus amylolyticus TaxID=927083 RepID=A0A0F6SFB2_9BACT|nr:serine/threonine-protein kinase [Sandaracinus amylolyticus]AKF06639.1 Serine/threonine protein kinase [Sandaracinus amylolyticus]
MLQPSDTLGSYTVLAHLRTGGMASLYLARRRGAAGFRKLVAIKVVRAGLSESSAMIRMFVHEARIAAHLAHPNVVHVEELGESAGLFYLVMEYVHGCSLSQLLRTLSKRERRLSVRAAVAIAMRAAEGLAAVHDARDEAGRALDIVHRDVSPQNVLISVQGHVKLIDFGVAKTRLGDAESSAGIKGKIAYMAPEQARAEDVDARADQYALGVMLWEMLTGRRMLASAGDLEMLKAAADPKVESPRTYATAVSPALEAVVMRALARDREGRFASVREMRRALAAAVPEALAVESEAIAELVQSAVGDDLARVIAELPDEATRALAGEGARGPRSVDEVLATLTAPASASHVSVASESTSARRVGGRVALALVAVAIGAAAGTWFASEPERVVESAPPVVSAVEAPLPDAIAPPVVVEAITPADAGVAQIVVAPDAIEDTTPRARRTRRRRATTPAREREDDTPRAPSVVHGTPILTDLP